MRVYTPEELAVLNAMEKAIAPRLKEAKRQAVASLLEASERGVEAIALKLNGQKVGKVAMRYGKEDFETLKPEGAALEFLLEHGLAHEELVPDDGWKETLAAVGGGVVFKPTGEDVSHLFCVVRKPDTAAVYGCKPTDVASALNGELPQRIAGLLSGEVA